MTTETLTPLAIDRQLKFIFAGNSTFTILSMKTGNRYTYTVRKGKQPNREPVWFVRVSKDEYIGLVRGSDYRLGLARGHEAGNALYWLLSRLLQGQDTPNCVVYHAGHCGRCGRLLTVPESIETGIGPECATRISI